MVSIPMLTLGQVEKGSAFLTGSVTFISRKNVVPEPEKGNHLTASADAGYLFSAKWAGGIHARYENQTLTNNSGGSSYARGTVAGPFARRYFAVSEKLFFHLDGGVNFSRFRLAFNPGVPNATFTDFSPFNFEVYLQPGASFFVADRFALQAKIGGISFKAFDNDLHLSQTTIDFNLGALQLGAAFYF